MKKFLLSLCLLSTTLAYAGGSKLKPLWQEEEHFAYYRVISIEGSVYAIDNLIQEARDYPEDIDEILDKMQKHIDNCRNCL